MNEKKESFNIRKSVEILHQGKNQNISSNPDLVNQKLSACGKSVVDDIDIGPGKIKMYRFKTYRRGRLDTGDCELRETTIEFHSDGDFEEITELHNHGKIWGDEFEVKVKVHGAGGEDDIIISWEWDETLRAGSDARVTIKGSSSKVKDNFDRITGFIRELTCDPDIR